MGVREPNEPGSLFLTKERLAAIGNGNPERAKSEIMAFVRSLEPHRSQSSKGAVKPTHVRLAVLEDRPAITRLTTELHDENGMFSLSAPKRDALLDRFYNREGAIIGVIGPVGSPVAAIYLSLTQPEYTEDWILTEVFSFVHPDHRRSDYARQLVAYAKEMADSINVPLCIGILSTHRTEAKVRLYEQFLDKAGAYFVYRADRAVAGG